MGAACRTAVSQVVLRAVGLGTGWGMGEDGVDVGGLGVLEGVSAVVRGVVGKGGG
jgi:hypothetical protein